MSRACVLKNFNNKEHSGELSFSYNDIKILDNLKLAIEDLLGRGSLPFRNMAKEIDWGISPEEKTKYEDSIADLTESIFKSVEEKIQKAVSKGKPTITLDAATKADLKKYIKQITSPKILSKTEKLILEKLKIEGSDLITEDDRAELRFRKIIRDFYGRGASTFNNTRQELFNNTLALKTIIDTRRKTLITNQQDLNVGITSFLSDQYKVIRMFLEHNYPELMSASKKLKDNKANLISDDMFHNLSPTKNYRNLLTIMYNVIEKVKREEDLDAKMEKGWSKLVTKTQKTRVESDEAVKEENKKIVQDILGLEDSGEYTFYEAVNAYVNLVYFDESLKQFLGDYISVDSEYDSPITTVEDEYGTENTIYKYNFAHGNSNAVNSWGKESMDRDALQEMSNYSKVLMSLIPCYEYNIENTKESEAFGTLSPKDFVNTMCFLLDNGRQFANSEPELYENIVLFSENPRKAFQNICNIIFANNNKTVISKLQKIGFDRNFINYLYSIYRTCFKGDVGKYNSWNDIEQKYQRQNGIPPTYPIIDTLLGVMNSSTVNNFLQSVYNFDSEKTETTIKPRHNDRVFIFNILNNVNKTVIDRPNKNELLSKYKLERNDSIYSVTINGITYRFTPSEKNIDILGKSTDFQISAVSNNKIQYLTNIVDNELLTTLETASSRRRFASNDTETDKEAQFVSILRFIDEVLNTNFSKDQYGFYKIKLMTQMHAKNMHDLFLTAMRALVITDIYNQLDNTKKPESEENYVKSELPQFLKDNDVYSYSLANILNDSNRKLRKSYFIDRTIDGFQLSTITPNEVWLTDAALAESILSGATSTSVINDLQRNHIPNYSPANLASKVVYQIFKANQNKDAARHLLFVQQPDLLKINAINTDVMTQNGIRKLIKNLTAGELLYDSIVNKFFVPMVANRSMYTQPTTLSDKTKFAIANVVISDLLGKDAPLVGEQFEQTIEDKIKETIGSTYKEIWKNVQDDYKKLFRFINPKSVVNNKLDLQYVQNWFNNHTEKDLINTIAEYNKANNENLVFYNDLHFRNVKSNGKSCLSINELLIEYATSLYDERLHERLANEKVNFVRDLIKNGIRFPVQRDPNDITKLMPEAMADATTALLSQLCGSKATDWVYGNNMILAKATDSEGNVRNVLYGEIADNETIELNPVLNTYFMLDNLIGNNYRMSLTGTEINHEIKSLNRLLPEKIISPATYGNLIHKLNPNFKKGEDKNYPQIQFFDIQVALQNYRNLQKYLAIKQTNDAEIAKLDPTNPDNIPIIKALNLGIQEARAEIIGIKPDSVALTEDQLNQLVALTNLYYNQIKLVENGGQSAQWKRNAIIPATMRPYTQNCITGIRDNMKIAVMKDVAAPVFNFDGKSDRIKAHDGAAFESPLTSILENNSLQDNEVGTVKKPIHHAYNDKYTTATLLKYAVDTITNRWMLDSEGNNFGTGIQLRQLFKKMHNIRWSQNFSGSSDLKNKDRTTIDLIDGCDFKTRTNDSNFHSIDFQNDILQGHALYYFNGDDHIQIMDFGREDGVYYTEETVVDPFGLVYESDEEENPRVYHYFDKNGKHIPSKVLLDDPNLHTIDSLYELHTALGGIYSESVNSEGNLQYSEASNVAVANFMNNVAYARENTTDNDPVDQEHYYQPLKSLLIDMVANQTAVKNGAGNVNQSSSFYDNTNLTYMEIPTTMYGIQLDADHTADEGQMTEFSQVISSLDAGGRLHDFVTQVYNALGQVALQLSEVELDAVNDFRNGKGKNKLVDVIGKTIINHFAQGHTSAGLAEAIINKIEDDFNMNVDHLQDDFKIPFSDPNIYSVFLSTIASVINQKSIKRQYPGLGMVIVPGYNLSMIYEFDGKKYQYEDLVRIAKENGFTSKNTDLAEKNRDIVQQFLISKQNEIPRVQTTESFMPTDNVLVEFTGERFNINGLNLNEVEYEVVKEPWREDIGKLNPRYKNVLKIYIKGKKELGSFDLVKDQEYGYYSVHFKTGNPDTGETYGSTPEERKILYQNLYNAIPEGAKVSTYGNVSPGGLHALNTLMDEWIGDNKVDNVVQNEVRQVKDREDNNITIPIYYKFGTGLFTYDEFTNHSLPISLDAIYDYYAFTEDPVAYLNSKGYYNITNLQFSKNVTAPRNLAPARISWDYVTRDIDTGEEVTHHTNIFNHWRIKGFFKAINKINNLNISDDQKKEQIELERKRFNPQQAFDELAKNEYVEENGTVHKVLNLQNLPAELIASNIYKSKFGIKDGDTLASIKEQGPAYFNKPVQLIPSTEYDLAFTRQDNKHLYITFKPLRKAEDETFDTHQKKWPYTIRREFEYSEDTPEEKKTVINRVYAITPRNEILFEIGREIINDNVKWNNTLKRFTDLEGHVLYDGKRYIRYGDKVLEYVEFVTRHEVEENTSGEASKYLVYNINRQNIAKALVRKEYSKEELTRTKDGVTFEITPDQKFNEEVNDFISRSLLAKIYQSSDYSGVQLNNDITIQSHTVIKNCINRFANELRYNPDLYDYLTKLQQNINNASVYPTTNQVRYKGLNGLLNEYRNAIAKIQYNSFLRAQSFTASRIPAQTLQSFMQMENVGFTGTKTAQAFVSHWQTWLQGSDYKKFDCNR